jgi:hypothetical protein
VTFLFADPFIKYSGLTVARKLAQIHCSYKLAKSGEEGLDFLRHSRKKKKAERELTLDLSDLNSNEERIFDRVLISYPLSSTELKMLIDDIRVIDPNILIVAIANSMPKKESESVEKLLRGESIIYIESIWLVSNKRLIYEFSSSTS